jgi:hypothetical protein
VRLARPELVVDVEILEQVTKLVDRAVVGRRRRELLEPPRSGS